MIKVYVFIEVRDIFNHSRYHHTINGVSGPYDYIIYIYGSNVQCTCINVNTVNLSIEVVGLYDGMYQFIVVSNPYNDRVFNYIRSCPSEYCACVYRVVGSIG
jgi:hypothetical protein